MQRAIYKFKNALHRYFMENFFYYNREFFTLSEASPYDDLAYIMESVVRIWGTVNIRSTQAKPSFR